MEITLYTTSLNFKVRTFLSNRFEFQKLYIREYDKETSISIIFQETNKIFCLN